MKYVKEQYINGHIKTTEISKKELLTYISDNDLANILSNTTAKDMKACVTIQVNDAYVGVQF